MALIAAVCLAAVISVTFAACAREEWNDGSYDLSLPDFSAVTAGSGVSEDGWYRTSEPGLCPAYRIEANAISVQTGSADGQVWQWLFDKASPSSAYGAATNEIYGVIIPPDLLL